MTTGSAEPEQQLHLPEGDEAYLASKELSWTLRRDGATVWLFIFGFEFDPDRFAAARGPDPCAASTAGVEGARDPFSDWARATSDHSVVLMIKIPAQYPQAKLDMFWTWPHLKDKRTGKDPDRASVVEPHFGRQVQRFSRHLPQWRPGVDSLAGYLALIQNILRPR